jgi:tetratricopeptide (TPR) repeat protein
VPSSIRGFDAVAFGAVAVLFALLPPPSPAQPSSAKEAERLAAHALATAASDPAGALASARKALAVTAEFVPTAFVAAGRKGEVVEDEYQAARSEYRRHRAPIYEAMGAALAAQGRHDAAARYLRRALDLAPDDGRAARLVESLLALKRTGDAFRVLDARARAAGGLGPAALPLLERIVDADGRPSVQVEIDRARLLALKSGKVEVREGPLAFPAGARLSTGAPLKLPNEPVVFYIAGPTCTRCSADLEALKKVVPPATAVYLVPAVPDQDYALRQVVRLYRLRWPGALGAGVAEALGGGEDKVVVVGRGGWILATPAAPFTDTLADVIAALSRSDLSEMRPRPGWNRKPIDRSPAGPLPGLLPEGFAPPDEAPAPPEFEAAVAAYREKKFAEALRLFDALAARDDGWLLPPEARLNRAIVLGAMGRREEARRAVLRIGDTRIADAPDRALEAIAPRR